MVHKDALRHLENSKEQASTFGDDRFGKLAENFARFFGTPRFIIWQTALVAVWIMINAAFGLWDKYPFILLNLMFSTQAAYAAPLILLAQTRQANRDKLHAEATAKHNQEESEELKILIEENTKLTEQVAKLTEQIHARVQKPKATRRKAA